MEQENRGFTMEGGAEQTGCPPGGNIGWPSTGLAQLATDLVLRQTEKPAHSFTAAHHTPMEEDQEPVPSISRGFISVIPKQPYYDWANAVFKDDAPMGPDQHEATAYAISDDFVVKNLAEVVKDHYELIFEMELWGVCTDAVEWPDKRNWKMFNEWFSYHVGSMVWDLAAELPLEHDEL